MKTTIVIIAGIIVSALAVGFKMMPSKPPVFNVQYSVECSSCRIMYRDKDGKAVKENVKGSWEHNFTGEQGHYAFVCALAEEDNSAVSTKIIVNGEVKESGTSTNKYIAANAGMILYAD